MYDPGQGFPPPAPFHFTHSSTTKVGQEMCYIAISLDGRFFASGSHLREIHLWDRKSLTPTGVPLRGHFEWVGSVCFTPDSRWLVSGSGDKSVRVWDCKTGEAVGDPLRAHSDTVWSVWTDGVLIISGSFDKTIRIWDLASRTQIGSPIDAGGFVYVVTLSNDGRIAAGVDSAVCVWDVKTRHRIASMQGHTSAVFAIAFSRDNHRIVSGGDDKSVRLWDTQTYTQIGEFNGHTGTVWSVSFSPDGGWVTSGGDDRTLCVWHCKTGQLMGAPLRGHTDSIKYAAVSPDGCQLISGSRDKTIRIWSKSTSKEWQEQSEQISTIHLSRHTARRSPHMIPVKGGPPVVSACYSPDRTLYAASRLDGHVSIWNTAQPLWESDTPINPMHLLRLTANQLIISIPDGSMWVWDIVEGKPIHQTPSSSGSQLNATNTHQFSMRSRSSTEKSIFRWIPFEVDAGLWAFVDNTFIRFEGLGGSVTLIDVGDVAK